MLFERLRDGTYDLDSLNTLLYDIPKAIYPQLADSKELRNIQSAFFKTVYRLLLGKEQGPRLYLFLAAIDRARYLGQLDFSYPETEEEKNADKPAEKPAEQAAPEPAPAREPDPVEPVKPQVTVDDFAKLDDVLDSKAEGESLTIRQKYYDYLLNGVKEADGTTRFLTYGNGWCGIAYNADYIDGTTYKVPRTTKELESLTATFAALHAQDGSKPYPWILYSDTNNNGYWNYSVMTWEAQYDGLDYYYNNMLALKDENGNYPSREVFEKKDGRYKALEVVESLLTPDTVSRSSTGTFTDAQAVYLDGGAIMMVNGNWLMNESTGTKTNVKMMRFPVISSIVEKLENTSMSDSTLAAIIDEVDAGKEESELCSASDFAKIKEARTIMYNNASEQYVFIPEYSPAKEGAKEFLKYFYSDKGIAAYNRATKLPASARLADSSAFDASAIPEWNKQQFDFAENLTAITNTMTKSRLFKNSSTNQFASLAFADKVWTTNTAARKDAEALWSDILSIIKENWSEWSKNV